MPFVGSAGFIVRIFRHDSATAAGIGFVVSDRHIVSCAHVINTSLGRDKRTQAEPPPGTRLQIDFPILGDAEGTTSRSCKLAAWLPPPAAGVSGGDVAGLLVVDEGLPLGAGPARLLTAENLRGAEVDVFGYPSDPPDRQNGAWAAHLLRSAVGGGIIQLDSDIRSALRAQPGYSGSPVVVAKDGDAVVGMLAITAGDDGRDAYAIPITQLAAAWPTVLAHTVAGGGALVAHKPPPEPSSPREQSQPEWPNPEQPTLAQSTLQHPALPQIIAGNWVIEIHAAGLEAEEMILNLTGAPSAKLQFTGYFTGIPRTVQGLWWVRGSQIMLRGLTTITTPMPQQYPYEVIITFASWSYTQLVGLSSAGENVIWRRQN
jgi:hypothetical protein